jgi:N-acetylglucosaminyl-diphospho-decaprenol L-rhamnosyltransferase
VRLLVASEAPSVGVIVVHYGRVEPTLRCLESIHADTSPEARTVVVVDNHGNLDSKDLGEEVILLPRPDNPGFGASANAGVSALPADLEMGAYLVLNNDVELHPGFMHAATTALSEEVGAAGGPVFDGYSEGELWYAGGEVSFLTGTVSQSRDPELARQRRDVGFIPGAAVALNPEAWRQVGGFDPGYFLYNEDIDLCLRLRRSGWRLVFEPEMSCTHFLGETTGSRVRSPLYLELLTRTRLRPFRPWPYRLYLSALHSLYNALRIIRLLLRHRTAAGPYVKAVIRGHLHAVAEVVFLARRGRGG